MTEWALAGFPVIGRVIVTAIIVINFTIPKHILAIGF